MSDFEQVQIDPKQFGLLEQRLNAIRSGLQITRERLGPVDKDKSIQKTLEDGFALIADALTKGDNQKLDEIIALLQPLAPLGSIPARFGFVETRLETMHGLVFDLTTFNGKVEEFMATQEERLRAVKTKLDAIQTGVDKIQQQLADLKANNPELDDEISAIEETAAAIDTDVNPAAVPPTEPPV